MHLLQMILKLYGMYDADYAKKDNMSKTHPQHTQVCPTGEYDCQQFTMPNWGIELTGLREAACALPAAADEEVPPDAREPGELRLRKERCAQLVESRPRVVEEAVSVHAQLSIALNVAMKEPSVCHVCFDE